MERGSNVSGTKSAMNRCEDAQRKPMVFEKSWWRRLADAFGGSFVTLEGRGRCCARLYYIDHCEAMLVVYHILILISC